MQELPYDCIGCGQPAHYTVLLALGPGGDKARYYLPNQHVRSEQGTGMDPTKATAFCRSCVRVVEDSMRDAINMLQQRSGVTPQQYGD